MTRGQYASDILFSVFDGATRNYQAIFERDLANICQSDVFNDKRKTLCKSARIQLFRWCIDCKSLAFIILFNRTIFVSTNLAEMLVQENQRKFLIGHELGHLILHTNDQLEADAFGARISNPDAAIQVLSMLAKGSTLSKKQLNLFNERIKQLQKMKNEQISKAPL